MMAILSMPKIKHYYYYHASFLLHNGCALEVITKMYKLNFYYQITEQLHGTPMGTVMALGGRLRSGRG